MLLARIKKKKTKRKSISVTKSIFLIATNEKLHKLQLWELLYISTVIMEHVTTVRTVVRITYYYSVLQRLSEDNIRG